MTSVLDDPHRAPAGHPRRSTVGLVAGGLEACWPHFQDLLLQLKRSAGRVSERQGQIGHIDVVDVGFISDAQEGAVVAEKLRAAGCDPVVGILTVDHERGAGARPSSSTCARARSRRSGWDSAATGGT